LNTIKHLLHLYCFDINIYITYIYFILEYNVKIRFIVECRVQNEYQNMM